ncbi:MAG: tetratricopeptide repeat protein, partial [Myxococcales bacterium]|nr:tetratricopeptide repeat protein [Myxococcales bacterium]
AEALYGPRHLQVGLIILSEGIVDSASHRDFDGALAHFRHALEIFQEAYGELHPRIASAYNNIGGVYFRRAQYPEAIVEFERSQAVYEAIYGPEHPQTMRAIGNLGAAVYLRGDIDRAIDLVQRTVDLQAKTEGKDTPSYMTASANLAAMLHEAGRSEEALPLFQHIYERRLATLGADDPQTLVAAGQLVSMALVLEDEELAARHGEPLLLALPNIAEDSSDLAEVLLPVHAYLAHLDQHERALEVSERLVALYAKEQGSASAQVAWNTARVARDLNALDRHEEARERASAALATLAADPERDRVREIGLLMTLAEAERGLDQPEAAREHYRTIVEILGDGARGKEDLAAAHIALAELSTGDEREREAQAALALLEGLARVDEKRAKAETLLGSR